MYFSIPVSFFPSVLESVGRLFMDGVLRQDLSEHWHRQKLSINHDDDNKKLKSAETDCETHLFILLGTWPDGTRGGAVLSQAVHRLAVHELDGADQTGAGAAVVLVAAWVAEVYVCANETLLVAQQDHDLCRETERERGGGREGESAYRREGVDGVCTHLEDIHGARTCCGGSCPLLLLSSGPLVLCWVHWCWRDCLHEETRTCKRSNMTVYL